jgi:hypothetical protein
MVGFFETVFWYRVARFFDTTRKSTTKLPNGYKIGIPNGSNIFQLGIKYTNIFHSIQALQDLPTLGFFGFRIYHLATLAWYGA